MSEKFLEIISDVKSYLGYLKSMGIEALPASGEIHSSPAPQRTVSMDEILKELGDCRRCKLHGTRRTIVFGEGNGKATLMFVGEGPGYDEDVQGRPFVGRAGQLLTKIIQSINLQREEVYIANIVKCRPPQNRTPEPDEIEACRPFVLKQIQIIRPRIICALGAVAAQSLLNTKTSITALRGRFHDLEGTKVIPTFHPAYLLRNPERKKDVWEDMKRIDEWLRHKLEKEEE